LICTYDHPSVLPSSPLGRGDGRRNGLFLSKGELLSKEIQVDLV
jgi:hypothetical protein